MSELGEVRKPRMSTTSVSLFAYTGERSQPRFDDVATEEPLQIRLEAGAQIQDVAVTMRTPGHDFELAAGFLFCEGIVRAREEIDGITYCIDPQVDAQQRYNIVSVKLCNSGAPPLERLERHFAIGSACGVCGKAQLESLQARGIAPVSSSLRVSSEMLLTLPELLHAKQRVFRSTGGLHASALFDASGALHVVREDIGRHNAMDKLIGWALLGDTLPLRDRIVMVSGRSSFEVAQKAAAAGIPIVCSVSAPSSLAIEVARAFNITLVGFLRESRFNVYAGEDRIR